MSDEYKIILPWISKAGEKEEPTFNCGMNEQAQLFVNEWLSKLGNRPKTMYCDDKLVKAAQKHSEYLYARTPDLYHLSMHIGRNGTHPNERARAEGYKLPSYYSNDANNIESVLRGSTDPTKAVQQLLKSPPHYDHLTGQGWYKDHIVYGVGNDGTDWVVLIAPQE